MTIVSNVETVTAGIDWLTLTLPIENPIGEIWVQHCLRILDKLEGSGYEVKPRTLQGYYGASAGNCFVGTREDGHMVQFTGNWANEYFLEVYQHNAHCSRIDVQCTVKYKEMPNDITEKAYYDATVSNLRLPAGRRRKLLLVSGSDGGSTVYIGSASSEQQARIYNKERQSEDIQYVKCWRYEVVYKNTLATSIYNKIPHQRADRAQWAEAVVFSWLYARGISGLWDRDSNLIVLPLVRTLPTDVEKRLGWLKKQVAPVIKKLIEQGAKNEVVEILDGSGLFRQD